MMLRGISDRARAEGIRAFQSILDRLRGHVARRPAGDLYVVRASSKHRADESVWWSRAEPGSADDMTNAEARAGARNAPAPFSDGDVEVTKSLDRIAETIDRLAAQLDAYHTERAEHLDAIQFLLREMVLGSAVSSPVRHAALGGIVEPGVMQPAGPEITIIAEGFSLEVDTPVEVRSRFHDRWICGFAIAEAIDGGTGPCRYRLTRRSDGIPLPILFDACDVRAAASAFERQPTAD